MRLHILVMAWWIVVALGRPYHSCFNLQLLSMPGLNCTILICRRSCTFIFNINKWLTNKIRTSNKSRFITCQHYQFVIILCIETTNLLSCHPWQWFDTNPLRGNSKSHQILRRPKDCTQHFHLSWSGVVLDQDLFLHAVSQRVYFLF